MSAHRHFVIEITRPAARILRRLRRDKELLGRIDDAIQALAVDPRPRGCKKLEGRRFQNLYRIRVGDWRILYAIEDERLIVLILEVIRRDQANRLR